MGKKEECKDRACGAPTFRGEEGQQESAKEAEGGQQGRRKKSRKCSPRGNGSPDQRPLNIQAGCLSHEHGRGHVTLMPTSTAALPRGLNVCWDCFRRDFAAEEMQRVWASLSRRSASRGADDASSNYKAA